MALNVAVQDLAPEALGLAGDGGVDELGHHPLAAFERVRHAVLG
jgi:hypothetical protein